MKKVIIIAGPTAVGKSDLAIKLAKKLNTEIISADSMQIYRKMDIGTAKIKEEEMDGIVHHMIDIVDPDENYSVQNFQNQAYEIFDQIFEKDMVPIVVGGTGLYIDSLVYDYDFLNVKPDYKLRKELEDQYKKDPKSLLDQVRNIDSDLYKNINLNDMKKMIRIIEVYKLAGKKINYDRKNLNEDIDYKLFVLTDDRKVLYDRINKRVDQMIDQGLVEEVKGLLDEGLGENVQSLKAIGYREVIPYLEGQYSKEEMIELIKRNSRRYAKRQLTWFRRNEYSNWIDISKEEFNSADKIIDHIRLWKILFI